MCEIDKKIKELRRKRKIFLSHKRYDLVSKVDDAIKSIYISNSKDKPLFIPNPPKEEEISYKTYLRTCNKCGRVFWSIHKTPKQTCILCKIENCAFSEAKKDFEMYLASDLYLKKCKFDKKKTNKLKILTKTN